MKDSKNQKLKSAGASGCSAPADSSHTSVPASAFLEGEKMKTVRLADDTCGQVEQAEIGDIVEVTLHDENGNEITKKGKVVEILED